MIRRLLLLALALTLVLGCVPTATAAGVYSVGDKMDDFTLTLCDGETVSLYGLLETHSAVLINIWATWCGPCQAEFPAMDQAWRQMQDDIAVIAVSEYDDNESIRSFRDSLGISIPMASDTAGLCGRFYYEGIPTSVMVDRYGVICWQESGAIFEADRFLRLFSGFTGDYPASKVGYVIPGAPFEGNLPDPASLSAALNAEGSAIAFTTPEGADVWPFLPEAGGGVISSNGSTPDSRCAVSAEIQAPAGAALALQWQLDTLAATDVLTVDVDGETVKTISGTRSWSDYVLPLSEGPHTVTLSWKKDLYSARAGFVRLRQARLLTGSEAEAALAAVPAVPRTAKGRQVELTPAGGQERRITFSSTDPLRFRAVVQANLAPNRVYITGSDEIRLRAAISEGDPDSLAFRSLITGRSGVLGEYQADDTGFLVTWPQAATDNAGYPWESLLFLSASNAETQIDLIRDEDNADALLLAILRTAGVSQGAWSYADGEGGDVRVLFRDADGLPVGGAVVAAGGEELTADSGGTVRVPGGTEIRLTGVPEGWKAPLETLTLPAGGGAVMILLSNAK